jgi:hypothetical protein
MPMAKTLLPHGGEVVPMVAVGTRLPVPMACLLAWPERSCADGPDI